MSNYWLELIEIENVAEELEIYLQLHVKGRAFSDPKTDIKKFISNFFQKHPEWMKFNQKLNVQCIIDQHPDYEEPVFMVSDINVIVEE